MTTAGRAAVVGAGPVGCLTALGLAQRGYEVDLFDLRDRIVADAHEAQKDPSRQRSINLAISTRGLAGLAAVDEALAETVLSSAVPMHARMIHTKAGEQMSQLYGIHGESINSVSRTLLNALVVEHAEANPRINVHYRHKLKHINFHARSRRREDEDEDEDEVQLQFAVSGKDEREGIYTADVVFGCDGMHSIVRSEMAKAVRMDFSQSYIDNSYVELHIPADPNGDFALDPNHLHIWPRHDFMLIALANQDKSFTSTLFAPSKVFDENLSSAKGISDFFDEHFADAVDLLGREALIRDISQRRPSPLATIRCRPYHYKSRAILLGDASHAMVPFYGQGLNCGLEDVRVMLDLIDKHAGPTASVDLSTGTDISFGPHSRVDSGVHVTGQNAKATAASASTKAKAKQRAVALHQAFDAYTSSRHNDLVAISELALDNYREMCSRVVSTPYLVRKRVDNMLMKVLPSAWWASLYTMVTFSNEGYHKARERERRQARILGGLGWSVGFAGVAALFLARRHLY
ncbi:FAD/NAD(P)-binding domain-containing protein [Acaromyces ingoldii]|uniref:Kynurenine 3-monooxygenase n=1 Tax=Acaromyces ingoldii TaxID=215250 RepID=A0A316YYN2_9BASI|nr:FAD/NAD(P)-binding domain-containing protein [Acaromyces ingoldii]PWN94291.1 FAD/NAD(P)-binding domain-containing protein [Acaromyces ingoldii]